MDTLEEMEKFFKRYNLPRLKQEEIKEEIKKYPETNGSMMIQNLWDTAKAVLRKKFIAI